MMKKFCGHKVKILLLEKEITQTQFASLINITPQYLSNILKEKKSPSEKLLNRMAQVLGVRKESLQILK